MTNPTPPIPDNGLEERLKKKIMGELGHSWACTKDTCVCQGGSFTDDILPIVCDFFQQELHTAIEEERKHLCKLLDDLMCFIPENRRDLNIFRKCKNEVIKAHVELNNPITMLWAEEWKDEIAKYSPLDKETTCK